MVKSFNEELFRFGNEIGRGGDGYVVDAENLVSNKRCAIKVVELDSCGKYFFKSERQIMHRLNKYNHKNILRADYFVKKDGNSGSSCQGIIVMDKMDCDLWNYMQRNAHLSEDEAKIIKQVCEAVKFMHEKKIAHLDLKLENILININNRAIKLCDFVRAFDWDGKRGRMVDEMIGRRISREYRAPEVANKEEYRADKLDQWSVGVILYYLLVGSFPHDEIYDQYEDYNEEVFVDIHSQYDYLVNEIGISAPCFNILCLLLNRDAQFRPSFRKIVEHDFFQ